jgi:hypothetical protein
VLLRPILPSYFTVISNSSKMAVPAYIRQRSRKAYMAEASSGLNPHDHTKILMQHFQRVDSADGNCHRQAHGLLQQLVSTDHALS